MHTAVKACLKYRVKHRQPHRTRLKLPVLLRQDALCPQIEKLLHELSGVTGVEVHARTGSVILEHPGGLVEIAAVLEIIEDAEFAFRISTVWKGFDLALLYYNGCTDDPVYLRDFLTDGRMRFTPRYQHYQAYGFNFAKGFERSHGSW